MIEYFLFICYTPLTLNVSALELISNLESYFLEYSFAVESSGRTFISVIDNFHPEELGFIYVCIYGGGGGGAF